MTYESLKNEVLALGYEQATDNEEFLLFASNRAQQIIGTDFPLEENYTLYQAVREPLMLYRQAPATLKLSGSCAISLRTHGEGSLTVKNADSTLRYVFNNQKSAYQFKIAGECELTLRGLVYDLAIYEDTYTASSDIPIYYDMIPYTLVSEIADFISLLDEARDETGHPIPGAITEGNLLLVPRSYRGQIRLRYRRREKPITVEEENIDIHPCAHALLPLLSGAYLWLDDEPEKAQYYMNLYREAAARLRARLNSVSRARYEDVLGWA